MRVLLARSGAIAVEVRGVSPWPQAIMQVAIVPRSLGGEDARVRHKTTDRRHYRAALKAGGTFEVLLTDEKGYLTEGCFSNIFVERNDRLVTPPLSRGLLPGVLRQSLIDLGRGGGSGPEAPRSRQGFLHRQCGARSRSGKRGSRPRLRPRLRGAADRPMDRAVRAPFR